MDMSFDKLYAKFPHVLFYGIYYIRENGTCSGKSRVEENNNYQPHKKRLKNTYRYLHISACSLSGGLAAGSSQVSES